MKIDRFVIISVVLCSIVILGEVVAYTPGMYVFNAEADWNEDSIDYWVTSSTSDVYTAIAFDNGDFVAPSVLYIYDDENYYNNLNGIADLSEIVETDIDHAIDQIVKTLKSRNFENVYICNSSELTKLMMDDPRSKGLLVLSYALPESVYSGSSDDLLFKWISGGGALYWISSQIGRFYSTDNGIVEVYDNQELFFGKNCINLGESDIAYTEIDSDGLTKGFSLKWNRIRFALDISDISGAISMGFEQDGYSSVSMVPFGQGMICVFGGTYDRNLYDDLCQIISSGISCYSEIIAIVDGSINKNTIYGSIDLDGDEGNARLYIYIGGYYTVYGRVLHA